MRLTRSSSVSLFLLPRVERNIADKTQRVKAKENILIGRTNMRKLSAKMFDRRTDMRNRYVNAPDRKTCLRYMRDLLKNLRDFT
jgi:hypothetical protein